jgi:phosphoglycolate phosphatase-like HAD superfamily hydrolase
MLPLSKFDVFIFDCDGVIFDSNRLKIDAMENALNDHGFKKEEVHSCIEYFSNNFGLSRYHHVNHFVDSILSIEFSEKERVVSEVLSSFGEQCQQLYLEAELTPGVLAFVQQLPGDKYIASGSAQEELRDVFERRGISHLFKGIYGSPTKKADLVQNILAMSSGEAVMFGDALSDLEASKKNNIDFVGYLPFSNVKESLSKVAKDNGYLTIEQWDELG